MGEETRTLSLRCLCRSTLTSNRVCRAVVGEVDEGLDSELDLGSLRAAPLKAIGKGAA